MNRSRITYTKRPDVTSEGEVAALSNIYRFLLIQARGNAVGMTGHTDGDDAKESEDVSRHEHHNK